MDRLTALTLAALLGGATAPVAAQVLAVTVVATFALMFVAGLAAILADLGQ